MKKDKPKFLKNDKPIDAISQQKNKVFPRQRLQKPVFHSIQRRPQGR